MPLPMGIVVLWGLLFVGPAIACFCVSYQQSKGKGFVIHNNYPVTSKNKVWKEIDEETKRKSHRLAKNVFFMLGILFILPLFYILADQIVFLSIAGVVCIVVMVYTIVRTVKDGNWK